MVELLTTVTIIGVISAIAIPSYLSYKNSSKKAGVESVLTEAYDKVKSNQLLDLDTDLAELNEIYLTQANGASWKANNNSSQTKITKWENNWCLEINLGDSAYNKAASCITAQGDIVHTDSRAGTVGNCGAGCSFTTTISCTGGQFFNGISCVCPSGKIWNGSNCI
ncbi:MAG: hypothetical protein OXJ52_07375 [Oligoflexia bacterium]|nr:hypothetical protein [Oligoflexia bacterium]